MMTIQQTIDIPADRRVYLELPESVPSGRVNVKITLDARNPSHDPYIPIVSWFKRRREEQFRKAVMGVAGKFTHVFTEDGVVAQRKMRDEWETHGD
jgi:hypothetical protein